jgi:hypothetical protein
VKQWRFYDNSGYRCGCKADSVEEAAQSLLNRVNGIVSEIGIDHDRQQAVLYDNRGNVIGTFQYFVEVGHER